MATPTFPFVVGNQRAPSPPGAGQDPEPPPSGAREGVLGPVRRRAARAHADWPPQRVRWVLADDPCVPGHHFVLVKPPIGPQNGAPRGSRPDFCDSGPPDPPDWPQMGLRWASEPLFLARKGDFLLKKSFVGPIGGFTSTKW